MAYVFKTQPGSEDSVEIAGVGLLASDARGGIPIADAARQMVELMDVAQKTVNWPKGTPLGSEVSEEGVETISDSPELVAAADAFAESRGLQVVEVPDADVPNLKTEAGYLSEYEPAKDVAEREAGYMAPAPETDPPAQDVPVSGDKPPQGTLAAGDEAVQQGPPAGEQAAKSGGTLSPPAGAGGPAATGKE